jgi:hypothetical protein
MKAARKYDDFESSSQDSACIRCGNDVLPGEEMLHERLQRDLIDTLARSHRSRGLVVQIEAKLSKEGRGPDLHGMIRSIEAAPGRYSCEFVEFSLADGLPLESWFFTVISPEEERSRAPILVLAKTAALIESPHGQPLGEGQFDLVVGRKTEA